MEITKQLDAKKEAERAAEEAIKKLKPILALEQLPYTKRDLDAISKLPPAQRPAAASAVQYREETKVELELLKSIWAYEKNFVPKKIV